MDQMQGLIVLKNFVINGWDYRRIFDFILISDLKTQQKTAFLSLVSNTKFYIKVTNTEGVFVKYGRKSEG